MSSHHRPLRLTVSPALALTTTLLVAACGGASRPPTATVSGHRQKDNGAQDAYRFSACMRTHGVTNFQDPHVHTSGNQVSVVVRVDPAITGSPDFRSAQRACAHLLPGPINGPSPAQRARARALLAFAGCMRQHGFPRFPDPTSQGRLTPAMLSSSGIDLRQPAIRPAAYACLPLTHGIITRADVNQAIANPSGGTQSSSSGG